MPIARVEILTSAGVRLTATGEGTPGSKDRPMDWEDILRKFSTCAALAAHGPSPSAIARVQEFVRELELAEDGTAVLRMLSEA